MSILNLIRAELLNTPNYIPGGEDAAHRLHANELPWSPIDLLDIDLNFYPKFALQKQLQENLASRFGVAADQLLLTRGSDDGIDLITRLFLTAGQDALMQFSPTFPMYAFYVRLQQAELIQCNLEQADNFDVSLEKINQSWQPNCKVIMFCSPNNPTANLVDLDLIAKVCQLYNGRSLIVVDEAYIEFAQTQSATTLIPQYENLVVLRTLSKASGLAGLRLGCILAQAPIIQAFSKIIAPYSISSVAIDLASKALERDEWFNSAIKSIQTYRDNLINELQTYSIFEKIYPSETNFILAKTAFAKELTARCRKESIEIRDFPPHSLLHDHLRITVGTEQQNQLLLSTLSSFINNESGFKNAENIIY